MLKDKGVIKEIYIKGMTCSNCEIKLQRKLMSLKGMIEADVSYENCKASLRYNQNEVTMEAITKVIEELGYTVEKPLKSTNTSKVLGISLILLALYLAVKNTIGLDPIYRVLNFMPEINQSMDYGMLFVVGLLTSIHCISMCGGINLSQCLSYKHSKNDPGYKKMVPSLYYNIGRVCSYTVIGGIVGALGQVISFSSSVKGAISIFAGVFMVIMGLNMLDVFPFLRKLNPKMPKIFGNKVYDNQSSGRPFYVGLLNGLMPCGPLQAMQLYALGSGSVMAGAISMFLFSLGTVPLMFGFGVLGTLINSKSTKKIFTVSAALVMILGLVMVNRGLSLSGVSVFSRGSSAAAIAQIKDSYQEVTIDLEPNSYQPIVVQKDIPVRFNIRAQQSNLNGCNNAIEIPKYNITQELNVGDNIIEFIPRETGTLVYTCWMGMISSNIRVVDDINNLSQKDIKDLESKKSDNNTSKEPRKVIVDEIRVAKIIDGVQYITMDVDEKGFYSPAMVVQEGVKTIWNINVTNLAYCTSSLYFPQDDDKVMKLKKGENIIEFTPKDSFGFSCWLEMNIGYMKVVKDIDNIDMKSVEEEIKGYIPPVPSCCPRR